MPLVAAAVVRQPLTALVVGGESIGRRMT